MMTGRDFGRRALATATMAAAGLGLAGIAAPAARADGHLIPCSKHRHEVVRKHGSVLWTAGGSLFGCVSGYVDDSVSADVEPEGFAPSYPPTSARRLGPWSADSRLVFDGVEAAWAYRKHLTSGAIVDRLYAVDVGVGKPWLRGARPTLDAADRTVADLKLGQNFAAWVTTQGTVMAAAEGGFGDPAQPDPFDLGLVGAGTDGAAGLVPALAPQDGRLLIGKFDAPQVQTTLRLKRLSDVDMQNEECIGSYRWEVTVQPVAGAARVGGIWRAAYFPHNAYCG